MKKQAVYGYARISTKKQNLGRQIENIKEKYPQAVIIEESYTGTKMDRPAWNKLYKTLRSGDTVIFDEVSRMSRNADEGFTVYTELYNKGVNLVFLKEPHINTATYKEAAQMPKTGNADFDETLGKGINEFLMRLAKKQIQQAFEQAQAEVDRLHQRTSEGVRRAIAAGKPVGRESGKTYSTKKGDAAKEIIRKYSKDFGGTLNDIETMKMIGQIARNSYYKYKREMLNEQ